MSFSLTNHCLTPNPSNIYGECCTKNSSAKPDGAARNQSKNTAASDYFENRQRTAVSPDVTPDAPETTADLTPVQSASGTKISVSNQIKAEITITTKDGDTVTLNTSTLFEAGFTAYNQSGEINNSPYNVSAAGASFNYSSDFSLSVDGQLDKEELRDIAKAIRQVNKIMRRLLSGDMEHALKRASKLHKLDTISGIEALLEFDKTVSVAQQASTNTVSGSETAPDATEPAPEPVESPSAVTEEPIAEMAA
jgi:hypothetical protein